MKPEAAWRRWLDFALMLVGLNELANFQKRPAAEPAVRLEEVSAARAEQLNVGASPAQPPWPGRETVSRRRHCMARPADGDLGTGQGPSRPT